MIKFRGSILSFFSLIAVLKLPVLIVFVFIGILVQGSEVKELGEELRKKTSLMIGSQDILTSDDLTPDADKGKTFDPHEKRPMPQCHDIAKSLEVGRTIEKIDDSELFLQLSQKITFDPSSLDTGLESLSAPIPPQKVAIQTCEESVSKVITIEQRKHIETIPAIKETRKTCAGHMQTFISKYPTKDSAKQLKKDIEKNIGENIDLIKVSINGRNVTASYKHKNPEIHGAVEANKVHTSRSGCFGYKTEEITIRPQEQTISWKASDLALLRYLEGSEHCSLTGRSDKHEDSRILIFRCDKGKNFKCQHIRNQGGILIDKECIETDPEGECITYRKTFEIKKQEPLLSECRLDGKELIPLENFETTSEVDPDFGEALSRLAAISEFPGSVEKNTDLMQAEIFPGKVMKCKRGCSRDCLYDCCGDPKGWLLGNGATCTKDEEKLWKNRKDKKCHFIGSRDLKFGLEKEQVYICYPNILSRIIQEEGRKQLGISWGTPEKPKAKGLKLHQLSEINLEQIDFSDFEVEMKRSIDPSTIQAKIQASIEGITPSQAKTQTENLLKEDAKKCDP